MKTFPRWCVLLAIALAAVNVGRAATDQGDRYLGAYFLIQEADEAEASNDVVNASAKLDGAVKILTEIQAESPDWNPTLVNFRLKFCADHLAAMAPKLPTTTAATPSVEMPSSQSESEQVRQLQAELQKTREDVKKLEQTRNDLTAKLEARLKEAAPTDRASAQRMLDQLRAMQATNEAVSAELESAKKKAARADTLEAQLQQSREKIGNLEAERTGLNAKLQEALTKISATETTPQVEELIKKNSDLTAQLVTAFQPE